MVLELRKMSRVGEVGDKEWRKVEKLQAEVADIVHPKYHHNFNYVRWLEYTHYDVKKAVKKLRGHLRLRAVLGMDEEGVGGEEMRRRMSPHYWDRWANGAFHERPAGVGEFANYFLVVAYFHGLNSRDLEANIHHDDFFRSVLWDCERMYAPVREHERRTGKRSGVITVIDMEGIKIDIHGLNPLIHITDYVLANYPRFSAKIVIVNTNHVVEKLWCLSKHLFPASVVGNIDFCPVDELDKYFDLDCVPALLGGRLQDSSGDPHCPSLFRRVLEPEDQTHHAPPFDPASLTSMDLHSLHIPRGGLEWVPVDVNASMVGGSLSWFYYAQGWHSFGLYYARRELDLKKEEELEMLTPQLPYFTPNTIPVSASIPLTRPGVYAFRFGNEGALFSRTKVHYRIHVHLPPAPTQVSKS